MNWVNRQDVDQWGRPPRHQLLKASEAEVGDFTKNNCSSCSSPIKVLWVSGKEKNAIEENSLNHNYSSPKGIFEIWGTTERWFFGLMRPKLRFSVIRHSIVKVLFGLSGLHHLWRISSLCFWDHTSDFLWDFIWCGQPLVKQLGGLACCSRWTAPPSWCSPMVCSAVTSASFNTCLLQNLQYKASLSFSRAHYDFICFSPQHASC